MSQEHSFWSALDDEGQRLIREAMTARRLTRCEKLLAQGDAADHLYVVNFGLF